DFEDAVGAGDQHPVALALLDRFHRAGIGQDRAALDDPQAGVVLDHGAAVGDVDEAELRRFRGERLLVEAGRGIGAFGPGLQGAGGEQVERTVRDLLLGDRRAPIARPRLHRGAAGIAAPAAEADGLYAELVLIEEDVPGKQRADEAERHAEPGDDEIAATIALSLLHRELDRRRRAPVALGNVFHG